MRHRRSQGPARAELLSCDRPERVACRPARSRPGPRRRGAPRLCAAGRRGHGEAARQRHRRGGVGGPRARRPPPAAPTRVAAHPRGRRRDAPAARWPRARRRFAARRDPAAIPNRRHHASPPDCSRTSCAPGAADQDDHDRPAGATGRSAWRPTASATGQFPVRAATGKVQRQREQEALVPGSERSARQRQDAPNPAATERTTEPALRRRRGAAAAPPSGTWTRAGWGTPVRGARFCFDGI